MCAHAGACLALPAAGFRRSARCSGFGPGGLCVCFGSPLCSLVLLLVRFVASLSLGFACLPQTPRFGVVWLVSLVLLASSALGGAFFLRRHLPRDHCRSDRFKSKYVLFCSSWVNMFTTPPHGEKKNHAVEGNIFERTRSRTKPPPGGQDTARRRLINSVGTNTLLRATDPLIGQYHLLGQYLTGITNYLFVYFD